MMILATWQSAASAAMPMADALWQKGDYRGAFAQAIEPAIQGNAQAQLLIGEAYRLGRSVEPDILQAEDWYARAAQQGNSTAATELGLLLAGEHRNRAALPWLTLAAQQGDSRALCSLAALYFNGEGVDRDEALAYALMVHAARTGLPEAKERLATLRTLLSSDAQNRGEELIAEGIPDARTVATVAAPARPASDNHRVAVKAIRVQVGAFHSAAAAEFAWHLLTKRIGSVDGTEHSVVRAGSVYRLQARLTGIQVADDFCRRLHDAHWQHFIQKGNRSA